MEPTKKFPIILMSIFVLVLSAITIAVIYAVDQYNQWQTNQQIISAILEGDATAVRVLEHSDVETQLKFSLVIKSEARWLNFIYELLMTYGLN